MARMRVTSDSSSRTFAVERNFLLIRAEFVTLGFLNLQFPELPLHQSHLFLVLFADAAFLLGALGGVGIDALELAREVARLPPPSPPFPSSSARAMRASRRRVRLFACCSLRSKSAMRFSLLEMFNSNSRSWRSRVFFSCWYRLARATASSSTFVFSRSICSFSRIKRSFSASSSSSRAAVDGAVSVGVAGSEPSASSADGVAHSASETDEPLPERRRDGLGRAPECRRRGGNAAGPFRKRARVRGGVRRHERRLLLRVVVPVARVPRRRRRRPSERLDLSHLLREYRLVA